MDGPSPERFTFFWSHRDTASHAECSQFFVRPFMIEQTRFICCEQYMHWRKALLFRDAVVAAQILAEENPAGHKALGRQVANFSPQAWSTVARDIVFRCNGAKFGQHADLRERLLTTRGTTLVEASPNDAVWGIGLAASDPLAADRTTWRGTNWLGEVLTELRVALCGD